MNIQTLAVHLSPVLHAEGVHVNDARIAVAQDMVELHVNSFCLLHEHSALPFHILQLVRQSLHVVLHLFQLEKEQAQVFG